MRRCVLIVMFLLLALLAGCDKSVHDKARESQPFQKISFTNTATDVVAFTVSSDSNLYVLKIGGLLTRYSNEGTVLQEYANTEDFTAICSDEGMIYAYDAVKHQIVSLNTGDGEIRVITGKFIADEVLKLVKTGEYLYALSIPEAHGSFEPGLNEYIDYGEILYRINLKTGKIEDTNEDKIIAIYYASDGMVYYYAYREDTYALYSYNTKNKKSAKLYDMNDVGYISAFIYEGDYFIYAHLNNNSMMVRDLSGGIEEQLDDGLLILSGNDMTYISGNVIYFGYYADGPNSFNSIYLGDVTLDGQSENAVADGNPGSADSNKGEAVKDKGKIVVSTAFRNYIDPTAVKQISGISTRIVDQSVYGEVLLTEIMAGDADVDIYIIPYTNYPAYGVKTNGIYVSLNQSERINSYMDKCFAFIADAMKAPSGDIWMLPISLDGNVIWYVPENIEKFDIDLKEFGALDDFLSLCGRMPKSGSYAAYVDYAGNFAYEVHDQFDMTYNDYANQLINFNSPIYKDIFDKMWTGWVNYSKNPRHPMFRDSRDDYKGELLSDSASYDKSKVIYKWSSIGTQVDLGANSLEGWRVLPMPHITSDVKGNIVDMTCAFINPYSNNKELALEYLEAIASDPFGYSRFSAEIMFKDKPMYADHYDINQPAFEDIYQIMKEGILRERSFFVSNDIVDDYQNGRLTLDEAVTKIQREAEMWLHE